MATQTSETYAGPPRTSATDGHESSTLRPYEMERGGGLSGWMIGGLALLALGGLAWYYLGPDVRRYLKIRNM